MTSKWFKQYCELNRLDQDMICDKLVRLANEKEYWLNIYKSIVFERPLRVGQIDNIVDRFNSAKDQRKVKRLIEKLERLRSQS